MTFLVEGNPARGAWFGMFALAMVGWGCDSAPATTMTPTASATATMTATTTALPTKVTTVFEGEPGASWRLARLGAQGVAHRGVKELRRLPSGEPDTNFWGVGMMQAPFATMAGGSLEDVLLRGDDGFTRRTQKTWADVRSPVQGVKSFDGTATTGYVALMASKKEGIALQRVGAGPPKVMPTPSAGTDGCETALVAEGSQLRRAMGHTFVAGQACTQGKAGEALMVEHWAPDVAEGKVHELPPNTKAAALQNLTVQADAKGVWVVAAKDGRPALARFDGTTWKPIEAPSEQPPRCGAVAADGAMWLLTQNEVWRWWQGKWSRHYTATEKDAKPRLGEPLAVSQREVYFVARRDGSQRDQVMRIVLPASK